MLSTSRPVSVTILHRIIDATLSLSQAVSASLEVYLSALEKAVAEQFRERRDLSRIEPASALVSHVDITNKLS